MKSNPLLGFIKVVIILILLFIISINLVYPIFYSDYVEQYSRSFDVDKYLVYSIIRAESNFNINATSEKNAKGLMQVLDETGKEIFDALNIPNDQRNLYEPKTNIMAGTYYIKSLLDKYNQKEIKAVAAYNSGMLNVDRWAEQDSYNFKDNIDFAETRAYVERVESNKKIYIFLYERLNLGWTSLPNAFAKVGVFLRDIVRTIRRSVV